MEMRTGLEEKPWWVSALVGLALGALLYWGAHVWLLQPKKQALTHAETELATLQSKIQEGRAAKRELPRFRTEVQELEVRLDRLLSILPARRNTPEILRRIRSLAEQGDFDLRRFTPGNFIEQDFYSEWPIAINLSGTYHNLALFFDKVSRFSRIINVEGLKIESSGSRGDADHTLTASFRAKTFVYREMEELDEGAEGGAQ